MENDNKEKPTECNGNCKFEDYILLSICTTCGADDWGVYPEPEIYPRPLQLEHLYNPPAYFAPAPWINALPWIKAAQEVHELKKLLK